MIHIISISFLFIPLYENIHKKDVLDAWETEMCGFPLITIQDHDTYYESLESELSQSHTYPCTGCIQIRHDDFPKCQWVFMQ